MAGCSSLGSSRTQSRAPASAQVELLYYADTLDAFHADTPCVPATRLGPASMLGRAPWATGKGINAIAPGTVPAFMTSPRQATQFSLGGYATLAAMLEALRKTLGTDRCLTLENGQCWNGGGMGYLTRGASGVDVSGLLGSDARVSSDERTQWYDDSAALYRRYGKPVLGVLDHASNPDDSVSGIGYFERGGVDIAVVGATNPYAHDEHRALDVWFLAVQEQVAQARQQADLVIVLADTGSGSGIWLAQRLQDADILLCARGLDLWPDLVMVDQAQGRQIPVCFSGSRGVGLFQISCRSVNGQWQFKAAFHSADEQALTPTARARFDYYQTEVERLRAPYQDWLDRSVGRVPDWLWRRDTTGGSWDSLILEALRHSSGETTQTGLSPGQRYDRIVPPNGAITRDHLLSLSGGHSTSVFSLSMTTDSLRRLLERESDQCFDDPILLDNSEDLPRVIGVEWECQYGTERGQRVKLRNAPSERVISWSSRPDAPSGDPLWQILERYLLARDPKAPLPLPPRAELRFVDGHPGWHPKRRLS
ncbi:lipoprotein UxpA [Salinicola corii]|uniref:Lipoprotein UxpA n=1 Tax=Salinicola corii TaxID=2606937 RepID=A0A640WHM9_9GAMM|nr:lipoprotein UxpA [Salinicola corii]KAA0019913.1 lipoprotein UxpA [Salinicola corii]